MNKRTITFALLLSISGFGLIAHAQFSEPTAAFVPPSCAPGSSACNPGAPINTSTDAQIKVGPLLVKRKLINDVDLQLNKGFNWVAESKKGDPLYGFETNALVRADRFISKQAEFTKSFFLKFLSSIITTKNQTELPVWKPVCSVGGSIEHCPDGFLADISKNIPIFTSEEDDLPTVSLTISPENSQNGTATLSWTSTNADICYPLYGHNFAPNFAPTTPSGSFEVTGINEAPLYAGKRQRRYVIACENLATHKVATDTVVARYQGSPLSPISINFISGMPKVFTGYYKYEPCENDPKNTCKVITSFPSASSFRYSVYNAKECQTKATLAKIGNEPASNFSPEAIKYYSIGFPLVSGSNNQPYPIYGVNGTRDATIDPQNKYIDNGSNYQEYEYTITCSNDAETKSISTTLIHQFLEN